MRVYSRRSPIETLRLLEQCLHDIQFPDERLLESLRGSARYQSFLNVGTPIDVNVICNLPKQNMKFLTMLKYHCLIRQKDYSTSVVLLKIDNLLDSEYDQQRIVPCLFNTLNEARLFILESNYFSDDSLLSYAENEYLAEFKKLDIRYSVKYKHDKPIKCPQRKRGYNDKGNLPDPRQSILGKNYPEPLDPKDLEHYWKKLERIKSYRDTISFLRGFMFTD